jgi:pimeloyl-ACP methyl ester carboxylesterase
MTAIQPFKVDIPDSVLGEVTARVKAYPWHEMPDDGGWGYGSNLDYMKELCDYWVNDFDWRKQEAALNHFSQFKTEVNGIDIHFIHEIGSGPSPAPLIISHGWPGTVVEFMEIIEPLAHPERFGGEIEDAFTVIAPSLPGFGFSGRPPRPYGPRKIAEVFNSLMTEVLGYESYIAQGGDWGGAISSWLGFEHVACHAIHINILTMRHPDGPQLMKKNVGLRNLTKIRSWKMGIALNKPPDHKH